MTRLPEDWRTRAACRGVLDMEVFYPRHTQRAGGRAPYKAALAICGACPVALTCLEYAMACEGDAAYRYGVWGGFTPKDRANLARRRRLGVAS